MGRFSQSLSGSGEKPDVERKDKDSASSDANGAVGPASINSNDDNYKFASANSSHRHFESYHVNLISVGGTIGTLLQGADDAPPQFFGNAELVFAAGKIILIVGLLLFTFVTMLGGNPAKDRFGFRHWKDPGAFANPYPQHGESVGKFEGVLSCIINAAFTIAGPDYLSMVAGEARNPRKTMPKAFRATVYRLCFFFIGSALAIGILVRYNDPSLLGAISSSAPGGARSPYVIAMVRLNIPVLPAIVNALILTSVFSAGNAFTFCASRTLAQLARDGQAPHILAKKNRHGVPFYSVAFVIAVSLLSYCQVSSSAQVVITWLTGLVGSCQLVNWCVMSVTWIRWNNAMKKQGISRNTLHARSRLQPFAAWWALFNSIFVLFLQGYYVFLKGYWNVPNFLFAYAAPMIFVALFVGWKVVKRTTFQRGFTTDVTSFVNDPEFDDATYPDLTPEGIKGVGVRILRAVF
ncbi:hypothetical protein RQP46_004386 [Phenoliferia psychrophenolica]